MAESARLDERLAVAHEERATALLAIGHHARAVPDLEEMVRNHPLRERPVELLMQALRSAGRQAEAIRAFQRYRRHLADETGLEPSSALQALCDSMFDGATTTTVPRSGGHSAATRSSRQSVRERSVGSTRRHSPPTDGTVAIKAIRPDLADSSEFIGRFEREAQLVARLEHPHIVPLYDYWREPGGAYLVFRLLLGGTARDASIAEGAWSIERVESSGGGDRGRADGGPCRSVLPTTTCRRRTCSSTNRERRTSPTSASPSNVESDTTIDTDGRFRHGCPRARRILHGSCWQVQPPPAWPRRPTTRRVWSGGSTRPPDGLDTVLARATAPDGGYASVAEFILAWRSMIGRPDGSLSPINSDEFRRIDSARRLAADRLARQIAAGTNPYKGLRPFDEADAAEFFGRTTALNDLLDLVAGHPLVAVVGASGSGKSSLVRAGLAPALRRDRVGRGHRHAWRRSDHGVGRRLAGGERRS